MADHQAEVTTILNEEIARTAALAIDLVRRLVLDWGDDGPISDTDQCLFCGGAWKMHRDLQHTDNCPYVAALAFLKQLDDESEPTSGR